MADLDLARRLVAHPRCPEGLREASGPVVFRDGRTTRRRLDGLQYVDIADRYAADCEWVPDLADAATTGVLLSMLPDEPGLWDVHRGTSGYLVRLFSERRYPEPFVAPTLGEAAARALLDAWRALDARGGGE